MKSLAFCFSGGLSQETSAILAAFASPEVGLQGRSSCLWCRQGGGWPLTLLLSMSLISGTNWAQFVPNQQLSPLALINSRNLQS